MLCSTRIPIVADTVDGNAFYAFVNNSPQPLNIKHLSVVISANLTYLTEYSNVGFDISMGFSTGAELVMSEDPTPLQTNFTDYQEETYDVSQYYSYNPTDSIVADRVDLQYITLDKNYQFKRPPSSYVENLCLTNESQLILSLHDALYPFEVTFSINLLLLA